MDDRRHHATGSAAGMTLVELLVGLAVMLIVALAALQFVDSGRRSFVKESDQADAQSAGRSVLELIAADVRQAGYSPLGTRFDAVPAGDASRIRLQADLDGDGVVGTAGEANENVTWVFSGPDAGGLYDLLRGVDLNGDGDFDDTDESVYRVTERVMPLDLDSDGVDDPFLAYDAAPPDTSSWVRITFGVRAKYQDVKTGDFDMIALQSEVAMRNRMFR